MDLSQDGCKKTTNEMMTECFGKIIQERRGVKSVNTDPRRKRGKKEGKIQNA